MNKRISVVMAVYNGEKYLKEQLDSIINQLDTNDELIISIDPSTDHSKAIAISYANIDDRIVIIDGFSRGVISNFENVLHHAKGKYIFLSDQDDIWNSKKINTCMSYLQKENTLSVIHDCTLIDSLGSVIAPSYFNGKFPCYIFPNIVKNRFVGCCMAFKRELLAYAMPFPKNIPMHDQWLGIIALKFGCVEFIDEQLIYYRRHNETVTGQKKSDPYLMIKWRYNILFNYIKKKKKL